MFRQRLRHLPKADKERHSGQDTRTPRERYLPGAYLYDRVFAHRQIFAGGDNSGARDPDVGSRLDFRQGHDSDLHDRRRVLRVYRAFRTVRRDQLLYRGGAGVHECVHGRHARVRQISAVDIRQGDTPIFHLRYPDSAFPVLSVFVSRRAHGRFMVCILASYRAGIPVALLRVFRVRAEPIQVDGVVTGLKKLCFYGRIIQKKVEKICCY